jgi:hypothetical protein
LWQIQEGRFGKAVPADITCIVASELGITTDMAEYEKIVQQKNVGFLAGFLLKYLKRFCVGNIDLFIPNLVYVLAVNSIRYKP